MGVGLWASGFLRSRLEGSGLAKVLELEGFWITWAWVMSSLSCIPGFRLAVRKSKATVNRKAPCNLTTHEKHCSSSWMQPLSGWNMINGAKNYMLEP